MCNGIYIQGNFVLPEGSTTLSAGYLDERTDPDRPSTFLARLERPLDNIFQPGV